MLIVVCIEEEDQLRSKEGKLYQPQTFEQYLKQLFAVFKKKGHNYCHQKDINGPGEFHAVLVRLWNEEKERMQCCNRCSKGNV